MLLKKSIVYAQKKIELVILFHLLLLDKMSHRRMLLNVNAQKKFS